ncbi:M12 family metallopeptidase [Pseudomonas sp.]|uniref:M12 family metallopeptidase n=1 Tax=Pseudomonas sp. TaxID=306 RepID=UPI002604A390|nr:M12 family metallopeptidase [Pseudomonas sp.]
MPDKLWPQHSVLTISLLNMTQEQKTLVKHNINKWAPHTNLFFKFTNSPNGDIRITADSDTGLGWSRVGTDAMTVPLFKPTMGINFTRSPTSVAATVQHEFGHALGLKHEHKHPDRTLDLNRQNIYDEYESTGRSRADANHDIVSTLPRRQVKASADYDDKSIMHYAFAASRLNSGNPIPRNFKLSEGDKRFMQSLYPEDKTLMGKLLNTSIRAMINAQTT